MQWKKAACILLQTCTIRNVVQRPEEERYRSLRLANKTFSQQVWDYPSARQFLLLVGWEEVGEFLVFLPESSAGLHKAVELLNKRRRLVSLARASDISTFVVSERVCM